MTPYNFLPIPERTVADLRKRDDAGEARKAFFDHDGGAPLRCCLRRSEPGDDIMLVSYAPLRRWARSVGADPGAYDENGPVFLHADACAGADLAEFPSAVLSARRVYRAYDSQGHIVDGWLVDPAPGQAEQVARAALDQLFDEPRTALVHVRAVEHGCFITEVRGSR